MSEETRPTPVPVRGDLAPDFTLDTTAGVPFTLSSLRGDKHVLLAFFPLAFTGVCTAELCSFTDDYAEFAARGVVVLPISVDAVPSLRAFKAQHRISVDLASDFRREVSRAYGVLNEQKFHSKRAYFLVDTKGVVRWSHVEETTAQHRENSELLAHIAQLAD